MRTEQTSVIKCVLNGISRKDTVQMIVKAYGIRAMKNSQVYEWHGRFENGQESINDEPRSGRPVSITSRRVTEIKELLELDGRITIREIRYKVDCSIGTVHDILHNKLNLRRDGFRKCCLRIRRSRELSVIGDKWNVLSVKVMNFLGATDDETWIKLYEPETKEQSTMWKTPGSPSPKKFKVCPLKKKQMFIVSFDAEGVILSTAVPHGQTIMRNITQR